ncbi:MAG: electron transport complex subunit RsxC [Oscillospiraceae bacterium]|nr:electron transport complex subunit RsxC [Oscillospiraceae bacterium]
MGECEQYLDYYYVFTYNLHMNSDKMKKKIMGISPPYSKNTANNPAQTLPIPEQIEIPMKMHSGKPAIPIIEIGDTVKVGQLIGKMDGKICSPVHSSVSGTVKAINERDKVTGKRAISVVIVPDGLQTPYRAQEPVNVKTLSEFLSAVGDSGAVGLGGAGFPTAPKLDIKNPGELDYILINGAECEPYITADTRTMIDDTAHVVGGVELLLKFMKPRKKILICIEDNKPLAIEAMQKGFEGNDKVEIRVLPTKYPQGERKVLVYNTTGRIVPEGARLADVGVLVTNITTITVFDRYIKTGMPLVNKVVTVDGPIVAKPNNVLSPIGTPIRKLFDFCGGFSVPEPGKILMGGPMMGYALPDIDMPVVKVTNSVLAFAPENAPGGKSRRAETACIKCGRCVGVCPMSLMPSNIEAAYQVKSIEKLERYKVNLCVECGSCAYVCPARRPLVQAIRLSNDLLWQSRK